MYGIVNNAIESLVTTNFGAENWQQVLAKSNIGIDYFLNSEPYDDAITFALAEAVSEVNNMPLADVFRAFGEWWIVKTGLEKHGDLMEAGGDNLKEFLINLPDFHNRILLLYPKLTPPEFKVTHVENSSLHLHYYSKRTGLKDFVHGLILGLGKMYKIPVGITLISSREEFSDHEIFAISW